MAVYGYLEDYNSQCNPFLLAWGWFETKCWTSGIIRGCGLLDEEGNVIEGGPGEEMQDEWEGDERLHWYVEFKGNYFWLKCSDFARYTLGARCFIYKNGLSQMTGSDNNMIQEPGCRWPYSSSGQVPEAGELLSDSNVCYRLDRTRDVIIPQTMYGIGA